MLNKVQIYSRVIINNYQNNIINFPKKFYLNKISSPSNIFQPNNHIKKIEKIKTENNNLDKTKRTNYKILSIQNKNLLSTYYKHDTKNPLKIIDFKLLIDKYNNFIFDIDGVLWRGNDILKNTIEAIKILKSIKNKNVFFLTNSNKSTRKHIQNKMKNNGLNIDNINTIYSSSNILSKYIRENFPLMKNIYVIGREGLINELKNLNFETFGGYEDDFKRTSLNETAKIEINEKIEACVCGFDDEINYYKIFYATQVINKTNKFFGTNCDKYVNISGRNSPGTYSLISCLETCTEKKAIIVSKPDPSSIDIIFKDHNIEKIEEELKNTIMIGDNMDTDIRFANNAGIDSLLVFTGITNEEKFLKINYEHKEFVNKYNLSKPTFYSKEIKCY